MTAVVMLALTASASPQALKNPPVVRNALQPHSVRTSLHNSYDETVNPPANPPQVSRRGEVYRPQGDSDAAIADFDRAIRIDPKKIDSLLGRGLAYLEKGDTDRAIRDFTQAIDLNPRHAGAIRNRAQAYLAAGDLKHAVSDYGPADPAQSQGFAGVLSSRAPVVARFHGDSIGPMQ